MIQSTKKARKWRLSARKMVQKDVILTYDHLMMILSFTINTKFFVKFCKNIIFLLKDALDSQKLEKTVVFTLIFGHFNFLSKVSCPPAH